MDMVTSDYMYFTPGISWLSTLLVFVSTFLVLYLNTRRQRSVPPGPVLLPVIGNIHNLLVGDMQDNCKKLRKQYGDIYGLYIGKELTIFLNGYDVIHNALVKHGRLFSSRPISLFHKFDIKCPGILFSDGKFWREHRSFILKSLQEICFKSGGRNLENIIHDELDQLTRALEKLDKPLGIDGYLHTSVGNVICMVLHRKRFAFDDKTFTTVLGYMRKLAEDLTTVATMTYCFPFLSYLPGDYLGIRGMIDKTSWIRDVFWPPSGDKASYGNMSLTDLYLDRMAEIDDDNDSSFSEFNVQSILFDLRFAGIDTTTGTILWALIYLVRHPDVQRKMFEEIKNVIGLDNKPNIKSRQDMPYVEAVILEVLRVNPVVPLAIPHSVSRNTVFYGYLLPANCTIIANLESVLKDPTVWKDPGEFRPERFLSDDETTVVIPKEFIPFSVGPRSCLGETLARIEIFMFLVTLVQNFEILPEKDGDIPEAKGRLAVTWRPYPCSLRFMKR